MHLTEAFNSLNNINLMTSKQTNGHYSTLDLKAIRITAVILYLCTGYLPLK